MFISTAALHAFIREISESGVVVRSRGQVQKGVKQQKQQQSQRQRQAPVVGDQHFIAASLQEGAVMDVPLLLHVGRHGFVNKLVNPF